MQQEENTRGNVKIYAGKYKGSEIIDQWSSIGFDQQFQQ